MKSALIRLAKFERKAFKDSYNCVSDYGTGGLSGFGKEGELFTLNLRLLPVSDFVPDFYVMVSVLYYFSTMGGVIVMYCILLKTISQPLKIDI